ncbi:MAG: hypothetical protein ACYC4L_21135 [Chloroflexota bacterium]
MKQAIAVLGLTVLLAWPAGCAGGEKPTPTPTAAPATPTLTVAATPTAVAVPTLSTVPPRLMVANTGGEGAMLRKTPGGEAMRAWADGSLMQTVGADTVASGRTWRNVKDPVGNVGWIAADFLIVPPSTPSPVTPAATKAPTPRS